jgi:hypothetical protein
MFRTLEEIILLNKDKCHQSFFNIIGCYSVVFTATASNTYRNYLALQPVGDELLCNMS